MFFNAGPTMTIDHSYWLLATGYWQLDDRIKLIGFSITARSQKPEARSRHGHKSWFLGLAT